MKSYLHRGNGRGSKQGVGEQVGEKYEHSDTGIVVRGGRRYSVRQPLVATHFGLRRTCCCRVESFFRCAVLIPSSPNTSEGNIKFFL